MSYTNVDLIRNHLEHIQPVTDQIIDQKYIFKSNEYSKFFSGSIQTDSVKVKSLQSIKQSKQTMTITASAQQINSTPIFPGSIICTSDSSLGTIYQENLDFVIDYSDSMFSIKSGGSLTIGMTIVLLYLPFFLYQENSDYRIDYDSGEIQKIESGDIQSGETLFLDYSPIYNNYTDDILNNAVIEANSIVEMMVDPNKQFGANPVLQTAATYRALEILCRSSAARELAGNSKNDRAALAWMKLADLYLLRSSDLIEAFVEPQTGPSVPTHS